MAEKKFLRLGVRLIGHGHAPGEPVDERGAKDLLFYGIRAGAVRLPLLHAPPHLR